MSHAWKAGPFIIKTAWPRSTDVSMAWMVSPTLQGWHRSSNLSAAQPCAQPTERSHSSSPLDFWATRFYRVCQKADLLPGIRQRCLGVKILRDATAVLLACASQGVHYRDLTPPNYMLVEDWDKTTTIVRNTRTLYDLGNARYLNERRDGDHSPTARSVPLRLDDSSSVALHFAKEWTVQGFQAVEELKAAVQRGDREETERRQREDREEEEHEGTEEQALDVQQTAEELRQLNHACRGAPGCRPITRPHSHLLHSQGGPSFAVLCQQRTHNKTAFRTIQINQCGVSLTEMNWWTVESVDAARTVSDGQLNTPTRRDGFALPQQNSNASSPWFAVLIRQRTHSQRWCFYLVRPDEGL